MLVIVSAPCYERCNTLLQAGVVSHISEGIIINMWSPCTNVDHAILKQSVNKALAAYAASPSLIVLAVSNLLVVPKVSHYGLTNSFPAQVSILS